MENQERPYRIVKPRVISAMGWTIVFPFISIFQLIYGILYIPETYHRMNEFFKLSPGDYGYITDMAILQILIVYSLFVIIIINLLPLVVYLKSRAREYRFFRDKIEVYQGFLFIRRQIARYDKILNVSLNKPFWERMWKTGTIELSLAGLSYWRQPKLSNVNNPDSLYSEIQKQIKARK